MSLPTKTALLLLLVFLLGAAGTGIYLTRAPSAPVETIPMTVDSEACRDAQGTCRASHPALGELQLHFPEGAWYMQAFPVELSIDGKDVVEAVTLDLTMPGMDMGRNRFALQRMPDGSWQGKVLLPICVTGRVDWQIETQVEIADALYTAVFPLNVTRAPDRQ